MDRKRRRHGPQLPRTRGLRHDLVRLYRRSIFSRSFVADRDGAGNLSTVFSRPYTGAAVLVCEPAAGLLALLLGGAVLTLATDDGLSDDLALDMTSAIIQLPPPDLGVLPELESNMRIMSSTPNGRDALAKAIIKDDYIRKLIPLVEMAEDLESVHDLHRLCNIMKTIITLNDTNIMEHAVSDECILGVVGALEYDPDFPAHKANHRRWLSNEGRYKEVVKIQDDQIDRKIHQTYRLQYLKDVVLARCLDDPTFSVLNSLIFFNQVDIVQHLQSNASLLKELFAIFQNPAEDQRRKKEAVLFIQSCCAIAKNLQPPIRQTLYTNFLNHGLLPVINFGLRNIDVAARTGATDVLVSMIDHDPQMIRHTIYRQIQEGAAPLTDTLIDLLLVEVDLGIRSQISDALKVLLDPTPPPPPEAREFVAGQPQRARPMPAVDPQQELFLLHFYENSAPRLFKPLIELDRRVDMRANGPNDGIYSHLNDILCFNIRQHGHRSRAFVVNYNLAQRYNQLLSCKEKHLQLGGWNDSSPYDISLLIKPQLPSSSSASSSRCKMSFTSGILPRRRFSGLSWTFFCAPCHETTSWAPLAWSSSFSLTRRT